MAKTRTNPQVPLLERLKEAVHVSAVVKRHPELTDLLIDSITELSALRQTVADLLGSEDEELQHRINDIADSWERTIPQTLRVLLRAGLAYEHGHDVCRICGCTEHDACLDPETDQPCSWAGDDLCSACAGKERHDGT